MEGRKQTLPSTRAHCPPGEQHNETSLRSNTALPSSRAEHNVMPRIKESKNSALPSSRAISGSSKE
ncbi:uncharacterized protein DS421_1g14710 [Arachis hypogaea]|nr:uncharacterized protein DS421_1g14710 [Arachis hypogaea]